MIYQIRFLSEELLFVRWYDMPTPEQSFEFIEEVYRVFDEAMYPIYVVSDLRLGYINDADAMQALAKITEHSMWAGGTSFDGGNMMADMFAGMFSRLSQNERPQHQVWETTEEAFMFIESLRPGITDGLDIAAIIDETDLDANLILG